jgi:hypothetical protein
VPSVTLRGAVLAAVSVLTLGVGSAAAYVIATGQGNGKVYALVPEGVGLSAVAPVDVTPGGPGVPLTVSFTNWNTFPVRALEGISVVVDTGPGVDWPDTCDAGAFTITPVPGPIDLTGGTISATEIPSHTGGVLTWADGEADQTACLSALEDIGGVPLALAIRR